MTEIALRKYREAVNDYRKKTGISVKTMAFALDGVSEQQLRNALNKNDAGPKAVEILARVAEAFPALLDQEGVSK